MVLEAIFNFGIWLLDLILGIVPSMAPAVYNATTSFWDIASFGVWVIGDNMWSLLIGTFSAWLSFKLIWGVILFIYRLIPLI